MDLRREASRSLGRRTRMISEVTCFEMLGHGQGAVQAGDYVDVMLIDGLEYGKWQ